MKKLALLLVFVLVLSIGLVSADISLSVDSSSKNGNPGDSLSYTLTVENTGTESVDVTLTSSELTYGTETISMPSVEDITGLSASSSTTVSYSVTLPSSVAGTYSGTVTAVDAANASNTASLSYDVVIDSYDAWSFSESTLEIEANLDESESETFTITNTGSTSLGSFDISFVSEDTDDAASTIEDEDGDEIVISFSGEPSSLEPGASATVTVNADVDEDMDYGETYEGTITVTSGSLTQEITLDVGLEAEICDEGIQGTSFSIDINDPDSGDDYYPGETIEIEVDVENEDDEDLDVKVEAIFYNIDEGKSEESVKSDEENIDEGESQTFDLTLEIPTDLDTSDTYYLYVKVYESGNEDDSCDYERVRIDLEREEKNVIITEAKIVPSYGLACGDDYTLSVEVENIGEDEDEDVYIDVFDGDLEVSEGSDYFDLGDYNDNDNDYLYTLNLDVPEDLDAGDHYLEVMVYFDDSDEYDSELVLVELGECTASSSSESESSSSDEELSVTVDSSIEVEKDELTIPLLITNNGDSSVDLSISVGSVDWADIDGIEYLNSLSGDETTHAYIYLDVEDDYYGEHDLVVTVNDDDHILTLDFGEEPEVTESVFSGLFEGTSNWWIVIDIILVVLALALLIGLVRK